MKGSCFVVDAFILELRTKQIMKQYYCLKFIETMKSALKEKHPEFQTKSVCNSRSEKACYCHVPPGIINANKICQQPSNVAPTHYS
jgi:hypothetical protein